ncbi:hypothetical protein EVAR_86064_1 [Eumeta japonica]|uniref:Uncharacterized protein n=1 Tax=Eumeta variegata TaxID=151549 RepID=A0A4C1UJA7_EUMVA|nr:hypothetical protein EVAR_86064_1 [Eumeta japonica]
MDARRLGTANRLMSDFYRPTLWGLTFVRFCKSNGPRYAVKKSDIFNFPASDARDAPAVVIQRVIVPVLVFRCFLLRDDVHKKKAPTACQSSSSSAVTLAQGHRRRGRVPSKSHALEESVTGGISLKILF